MNLRISSKITAAEAWGTVPDWVAALAKACDQHQSQKKVADIIGYSPATISLVLKKKYAGDYDKVEVMVRGALLEETVNCPVFALIDLKACSDYQSGKRITTGPFKNILKRRCPACDYRESKNGNQ